jgi:hypothetical protein
MVTELAAEKCYLEGATWHVTKRLVSEPQIYRISRGGFISFLDSYHAWRSSVFFLPTLCLRFGLFYFILRVVRVTFHFTYYGDCTR